jgi:flagellar biogenesis protein FliO
MENVYIALAKVIFVLLAMLGVLAVVHRYAGKVRLNLTSRPGASVIRKGDTVHLGYRKFLSVVDVKDRTFLLAIGQDQVSLLYHWEKEKGAGEE